MRHGWFDDLPGNEAYWKKPKKKTDAIVSVNELPQFPQKASRSAASQPAMKAVNQ